MEPDGSQVKQITDDPVTSVTDAVWSPDGQRIALVLKQENDVGIYIINTDGTGHRRIVGSGPQFLSVMGPIWSPDGQRIAFTALMPPDYFGIYLQYVIDVSGDNLHQITTGAPDEPAVYLIDDWSNDGTLLLGASTDSQLRNGQGELIQNKTVVTYTLGGTIVDRLIETEKAPDYLRPYSFPNTPLWSPDEQHLVFTRRVHGYEMRDGQEIPTTQEDLYLASADGIHQTPLTEGAYHFIYAVAWSSDGSRILADGWTQFPNRRPHVDPQYIHHVVIVQTDGTVVKDFTPFPRATVRPTTWRQ